MGECLSSRDHRVDGISRHDSTKQCTMQEAREDPGTDAPQPIPGLNEEENHKAAILIQKTYRGHRARRQLDGFGLDASTRWQ